MKAEDLKLRIAATSTKKQVTELTEIAKQKGFAVKDLIELTFDDNRQTGFHACRVLDELLQHNPELILAHLDALMLRLPQVFNQSCKRHYARIFMHATSAKAIAELRSKIAVTDLEPLVETCFNWLIDPEVAVAVKVFCIEILFNLRKRYDWIADELAREVEFLMKNGSAAMQSKGKKILKALQE